MPRTKKSINQFHDRLLAYITIEKNEEAQEIMKNVDTSDLIDSSGKSLLHCAVTVGNEKMTKHLITDGYNVDIQNKDGNTPLMLAVEADKTYVIEMLMKSGANIHICNIKGDSPVKFVLKEWSLPGRNVVKLFLIRLREECGTDKQLLADKLMEFKCPVYFAVLLRDAEVTRMMLDRGCSIKARCRQLHDTALHETVAQSDLANVKLLVERGACINDLGYQKEPPLCRYNIWTKDTYEKLEMLKFLVKKGSALHCPKESPPLKRLFKDGNKETVCTLLQIRGINLRTKYSKNRTCLHLICRNKNPGMAEAIELFRGKDFDIDAVDENKWTALMTAACRRYVDIVECLLKMGANVNICNNSKMSVLHEACRNDCWWIEGPLENNAKIADLLLQYGIDILHCRNNCGEHFLSFVSYVRRHSQVARIVLARLALMEVLGEFGIINIIRTDIIKEDETFEEYYVLCLKHLEEMQTFEVYRYITLSDLLIGSERKLNVAVRNRDFLSGLTLVMAEKRATIPYHYLSTIDRRVRAAIARIKLDEKAAAVVCNIIGLADEHIVAYEIVCYLNLQDLKNLIETI